MGRRQKTRPAEGRTAAIARVRREVQIPLTEVAGKRLLVGGVAVRPGVAVLRRWVIAGKYGVYLDGLLCKRLGDWVTARRWSASSATRPPGPPQRLRGRGRPRRKAVPHDRHPRGVRGGGRPRAGEVEQMRLSALVPAPEGGRVSVRVMVRWIVAGKDGVHLDGAKLAGRGWCSSWRCWPGSAAAGRRPRPASRRRPMPPGSIHFRCASTGSGRTPAGYVFGFEPVAISSQSARSIRPGRVCPTRPPDLRHNPGR